MRTPTESGHSEVERVSQDDPESTDDADAVYGCDDARRSFGTQQLISVFDDRKAQSYFA